MKHDEVMKHWNENAESWVRASKRGFDIWRDALNTPAFLKSLPNTKSLKGLDIGCGDGHNSKLIAKICSHLTGVDISEKLLLAAKKNIKLNNLTFIKANATTLPFQNDSFDFVVATMSFMDIAEIEKVITEAYRVLNLDGFLQFSIIHPCFNEHKGRWVENESSHCAGFIMKDYFAHDKGDIHEWRHSLSPKKEQPFRVPRFSKPLNSWFNMLFQAGFYVERLEEPYADDATLKKHPQLKSTRVVAHSLIIRCRKIRRFMLTEEILKKLPGNVWWKDKNLIYQGCNEIVSKMIKETILKEIFDTLVKRSADCEAVRKRIINATSVANLEVKNESFSIVSELITLVKELRTLIGSKPVKLIINPLKPKKEDIIETDRLKFHDILYDLISNAINFTEKGAVTVSVIKQNKTFHIKVSDTGIGIPRDKFDYIFEQYTKLSRSNKYGASFKGVGAGLYLARIRANILNATIGVESKINKGSTFTLSIPVTCQ